MIDLERKKILDTPLIGFVFTNYNNAICTIEAVKSIHLNEKGVDVPIVIVDNKSDDVDIGILKQINNDFRNTHIIFNNENIGYFKGLNKGIEYLLNSSHNISYIVVGNNDLVFPSNFVQSIHNNLKQFDLYAVISPDIVTLDGVHQNPHVVEKISIFRELIYDLYYFHYWLALAINFIAKITKLFTDRRDENQYEIAQAIYQGYGACYILGPLFFKHFNLLWAPTFLMGEELFLSKQLESKGLQIYYEPNIVVKHHDHATVSKIHSKRIWQISRASHKVYRKYVKVF
jgi:GT2 family glycosyltransferase